MNSARSVAILGTSGFIGSRLRDYVLSHPKNYPTPLLITRKACDHLDAACLKRALVNAQVIYDTAGLAWQHISQNTNSQELLIEQVLQNSVSAYIIGRMIRPNQMLVWTSTNAIDLLLARLPPFGREVFEEVSKKIVNSFFAEIDLKYDNFNDLKLLVYDLVYHYLAEILPVTLDFSYAYSKYLGEKILEKLSAGNIRILKISDVYGRGQLISKRILDPATPARRIQRFVAAYKLIAKGESRWVPKQGNSLHGFFKSAGGYLAQEVWNDYLFPTYIDDVVSMIIRAGKLENHTQSVFQVAGNRLSNYKMAQIIRDFFEAKVSLFLQKNQLIEVEEQSSDLSVLGLSRQTLTPLPEGLRRWVK